MLWEILSPSVPTAVYQQVRDFSLRALRGVGLTNHQKAFSQGPFRHLMWHYVSTTRNPHVPLSSSHQGGTGVGENLVKGELGTWPHWAPVQGTSTPTGSLGVVTYLIETRQVIQMSYAALYKHLALFAVTIYRYVHMSLKHIFLHQIYRNAMRSISTPDQFTHILPSTI